MQRAPLHLLLALIATSACSSNRAPAPKDVVPAYDQKSGKLTQLKYDENGDGKTDRWAYMDGTTILRVEADMNGDGIVDRCEYYAGGQTLEKVALSTAKDGKLNRIEFYQAEILVRAEEDADGDGKADKWETFDGSRLASVAFDTQHRGTPDRRLIYGRDGTVSVETDTKGSGTFEKAVD